MTEEYLDWFSFSDLEGRLETAIERLKRIQTAYPDKAIELVDDYERYGEERGYRVVWVRPENETEAAKRLKDEAESKEYRRKQFERLKEEFG
jgi:hypothetical protein